MTTVFRRPSTAASPSHADGVMRHGFASFFRAPVVEDMAAWHADVGFAGVPFDGGTNDRPGARFGPAAIRDASTRYEPGEDWSGWIDAESGARILAGVSMADVGDVDVRTVDLRENFDIITEAARLVRRNCRVPVFVGGDHAITFPIVRAFDDTPLTLIQFDAHQDYTDDKYGVRYSHDNHMRRSSELPHVKQIVQIGLRGVIERFEPWEAAQRDGVIIVPAERIVREGVPAALSALPGPAHTREGLRHHRHRRARPGVRARHRLPGARRHHLLPAQGSAAARRAAVRRHRPRPHRSRPHLRRRRRHPPHRRKAAAGCAGRRVRRVAREASVRVTTHL